MIKKLSECSVLVVDDTATNIDIIVEAVGEQYDLSVATDGATALELAEATRPDLILLDIMMPDLDGYDVIRRLKANPATAHIPVIFLTALREIESKTKGFELGAVDYITKPFDIAEVKARLGLHLNLSLAKQELARQNEILEIKVQERTAELVCTQDVTIHCMAVLAEFRDPETGGHIMRTQNYVKALADRLHKIHKHREVLTPENNTLLYKSAPLHDIGKIGISDKVLLKPGKLDDEEWTAMKKHPVLGFEAIQSAQERLGKNCFLHFAGEIARWHHEKWDGSGYPDGLSGEQIPLAARLMALADVYDALVSKRVYKPAFPHSKAVDIIGEGKGSHFDPDIADAFMDIHEDFRHIAIKFADQDKSLGCSVNNHL